MSSYHYEDMNTARGRLVYLHLAEKSAYGSATPAYSAGLLLDKNDPKAQAFIADLQNRVFPMVAQSRFGANVPPAAYTDCIKDGDRQERGHGLDKNGNPKKGFAGHWFINFKDNNNQPDLVDAQYQPILTTTTMGESVFDYTQIKSGDWGHLAVTFGPTEYEGNKYISAFLRGVCKEQDGEKFGGGSRGPAFGAPAPDMGAVPPVAQAVPQQPQVQQAPQMGAVPPVAQVAPPAPPQAGWSNQAPQQIQ